MLIKDNNIFFKHKDIEFPVAYKLKVIMDATVPDDENSANINEVFEELSIPNSNWKSKLSKKGNYISFSIMVHVKSQEKFDALYSKLDELEALKWAV